MSTDSPSNVPTNAVRPSVTITCNGSAKSGKAHVVATFADGTSFTSTIKIGNPEERAKYRDVIRQRCAGLPIEDIEATLETLAADLLGPSDRAEDGGAAGEGAGVDRPSIATQIVGMIEGDEGVELFHTPGGMDAEGYATITNVDHHETWAISSRGFKQWACRRFFNETGKVPTAQSLADSLGVLAGKATFEGEEREVHVRVATHAGEIWVDLADETWRAIRVTAEGWQVIDRDIPVRFVRKRGMQPLPVPVRGGTIQALRSFVNLGRDEDWVLAVSWVIAAFRPNFPFPILNVNGEHGSAKSTLCKMLRALVDPAKPPLRRPPKDERDLAIAAANSHIVSYDNISGITPSLSDSLCCLATGGGFGVRELYTDGDESLFDFIRPVLLNGIDDSVTRSDLLDRALNLDLPRIPDGDRRDENLLWVEFERARPSILGAILDAIVVALRNLPATTLDCKPRMADFAMWIVAAERALPWAPGQFLAVYNGNRIEADVSAVEGSAVGPSILAMLEERREWSGTAGALLILLNERYTEQQTRDSIEWPKTRKAMGNAVRRIAPNLRRMGVMVELPDKGTGNGKERIFRLERAGKTRSARSASSANPALASQGTGQSELNADCPGSDADRERDQRSAIESAGPLISEPEMKVADRADHADRASPDCSQGGGE